jgi:hypothetical protein
MSQERNHRRKYRQALEERAKETNDNLKAAMFFDRISLAVSLLALVLSVIAIFS